MAWDTERTRQLLLDAAVSECEHGPEGASKERIYQYLTNKHAHYSAVMEWEMTKLAAAVPLTPEQAADLGEFAARIYDYHRRNPRYLRLLLWEGLDATSPAVPALDERRKHYKENIESVAHAQRDGEQRDDLDSGYLLYAARALAVWRLAIPTPVAMMLGATTGTRRRRAALVDMVRRITVPQGQQ